MYLVVPPGGCFRETRRIELGARALVLGRAEKCDVRVDVPGVDDEHAKISEVALIAMGPDCAIGDVPLDPGCRRLITPGDEIQIGSVVVALEGDDPGALALADAQRKPLEGPRVRVVEGQSFGEELVLKDEGREYVVGRGPKCDLVLEDREVSREHFKLIRRGYSVWIKDLGSTRGSWLGRSSVYTGSTSEWQRPRMLRVGATVLSLELPDEIRKNAPQPLASAPMTPEPRSRTAAQMQQLVASTQSPPPPPVASAPGLGAPASTPETPPPSTAYGRVHPYSYDPTPPPGPVPLVPGPPSSASAPPPPASTAKRTAWKKTGPTIGKGSGVLLLALAALAVLGALFVVFSLLE